MKERPIIFSWPSVIQIQKDLKTQTRRTKGLDLFNLSPNASMWQLLGFYDGVAVFRNQGERKEFRCPYGVPGDRLWVRETWAPDYHGIPGRLPYYRADLPSDSDEAMTANHAFGLMRWNNAMFMPRSFARLLLEITDVRVQRLQEIDEADAQREGWAFEGLKPNQSYDPVVMDTARQWYRSEWDRINAKRGFPWSANPWIWTISFKRITEVPHV